MSTSCPGLAQPDPALVALPSIDIQKSYLSLDPSLLAPPTTLPSTPTLPRVIQQHTDDVQQTAEHLQGEVEQSHPQTCGDIRQLTNSKQSPFEIEPFTSPTLTWRHSFHLITKTTISLSNPSTQMILTRSLVLNEKELQAFFECVLIHVELDLHPKREGRERGPGDGGINEKETEWREKGRKASIQLEAAQ